MQRCKHFQPWTFKQAVWLYCAQIWRYVGEKTQNDATKKTQRKKHSLRSFCVRYNHKYLTLLKNIPVSHFFIFFPVIFFQFFFADFSPEFLWNSWSKLCATTVPRMYFGASHDEWSQEWSRDDAGGERWDDGNFSFGLISQVSIFLIGIILAKVKTNLQRNHGIARTILLRLATPCGLPLAPSTSGLQVAVESERRGACRAIRETKR